MNHVDSVRTSGIKAVDKPGFWYALREGQIMFCAGNAGISKAIEKCTNSPWSHVTRVVRVYGVWCVLEAVWPHGVTFTPMWQYIDRYDGDLVLTRRVDSAGEEIDELPAIVAGINLLGRDYAALGLVKEGLHRLIPNLPAEWNDKDCYCSGAVWLESKATAHPFPAENGAPSPEDLWIDPTVQAVCALVR